VTFPDPSMRIHSPEYWHGRAKEARTLAESTLSIDGGGAMLKSPRCMMSWRAALSASPRSFLTWSGHKLVRRIGACEPMAFQEPPQRHWRSYGTAPLAQPDGGTPAAVQRVPVAVSAGRVRPLRQGGDAHEAHMSDRQRGIVAATVKGGGGLELRAGVDR